MDTYIIQKTDLFYKGKLYPEGTNIKLSNEDKQGLDDYLIPLAEKNHSAPVMESASLPDLTTKTTINKRNNK